MCVWVSFWEDLELWSVDRNVGAFGTGEISSATSGSGVKLQCSRWCTRRMATAIEPVSAMVAGDSGSSGCASPLAALVRRLRPVGARHATSHAIPPERKRGRVG